MGLLGDTVSKAAHAVGQAVKDTWNGEHRCASSDCNELHMGSPVRTVGGKWNYYCGKHKAAGGGTKPVNVLAAAEKKAKAEARRAEREANKPPKKSSSRGAKKGD